MKEIQIAPYADEITREGTAFSCEFNGMKIEWDIEGEWSDLDNEIENRLKNWLSTAIAMSGKLWQVPYVLNKNLPFTSKVYVNGKEVEYPKD